MFELAHRVRVFVFQVLDSGVQYLLLRQKPCSEWPLGPVIGPVGIHEHLKDAILREVEAETGLRRPHHVLELPHPEAELFGDGGLVEWRFAFQAGTPDAPVAVVRPGPMIGEFAWMRFEEAFQRIESLRDRDALVRLQLRLAG